ncbi:MAG: adenylate/guanylate cyclase domain-containing protein, partial [Alphaproteobacteria bacterium]
RLRVISIFTISFIFVFIFVFILFYLFFQFSDQRILTATLLGQSSTWLKVQESTYQKMLFHAYDESPGKASIWRLRGKRSPIQAIKSGNKKRISRAIRPLYQNLSKSGVLDFIWIHKLTGEKIIDFGKNFDSKNFINENFYDYSNLISFSNTDRQIRKNNIYYNDSFFSTITFPIYANARKIGIVVYGKLLNRLVDDLSKNTKTLAFIQNHNLKTVYKTTNLGIPINNRGKTIFAEIVNSEFFIKFFEIFPSLNLSSSALNLGSYSSNFINYDGQYYRSTNLKVNQNSNIGEIVLLTNSTADYTYQKYYLLILSVTILGLTLIISFVINTLLRRRFKPLDQAIDVLGALSKGDTSVDISTNSKDEVGRIASAVSSFRTSLIEREKIRGLFGKYIPEQIAEQLMNSDENLEPQLSVSSIVFIDLAGFTSLSEGLPPQAIVTLLNEYFSEIVEIIEKYDGIVAQFQGDAVLAVFNELFSGSGHQSKALEAALQIKDLVANKTFGGHQLSCRIGLSSGQVVSGNVGAKDRLSYTVYGDVVNLASRLENLNKNFETVILFDENIANSNQEVKHYEIGKIDIRGKKDKVRVYSV